MNCRVAAVSMREHFKAERLLGQQLAGVGTEHFDEDEMTAKLWCFIYDDVSC